MSLELRPGDVQYVYDRDTAGIRTVANGLRGYVAGPWHLPIGLTVAELAMRYETQFYYSEAQTVGHCAALAAAKVTVGYPEITVYISSDYPEGSCEFNAILAHEHEHVEIIREQLLAYKAKFEEALRRVLQAKKAIYTLRKGEARSAYILELQRQLEPVVAEMAAERNLRNGAIDTRDNYQRLMAQCRNWRGGSLPASGSDSRSDVAAIDNSMDVTRAVPPSQTAPSGEPAEGGDTEGSVEDTESAAVTESSRQGRKSDQDPVEFVQQGRQLSKANAKQLETALKTLPYDFPTRARLLGFYFHNGLATLGQAATIEARRRHIQWLIENHPESPVAGLPEAIIEPDGHPLADEEGYRQARDLWLEQAEMRKDDPAVRRNAATFLQPRDKAMAEERL